MDRKGVERMLNHIQVSPPPTDKQLSMFVSSLDADGNGSITLDEMINFCIDGMSQSDAKRKAFAARSQFHEHLVALFEFLAVS